VQFAGFSCGVTILSELVSVDGVQPVSLHNPLHQVPVTKRQPLSQHEHQMQHKSSILFMNL
jgi:hypothetical protein